MNALKEKIEKFIVELETQRIMLNIDAEGFKTYSHKWSLAVARIKILESVTAKLKELLMENS